MRCNQLKLWGSHNMFFAPLRAGELYDIVNPGSFAYLLDAVINGLVAKVRKMVVVLRQNLPEGFSNGDGYLLVGFCLIESHVHPTVFIRGNLIGGDLPIIRNPLTCIDADKEEVACGFVGGGEV